MYMDQLQYQQLSKFTHEVARHLVSSIDLFTS
jgi:hypothetical protein